MEGLVADILQQVLDRGVKGSVLCSVHVSHTTEIISVRDIKVQMGPFEKMVKSAIFYALENNVQSNDNVVR